MRDPLSVVLEAQADDTKRIVVCDVCGMVIARQTGKPVDRVLCNTAAERHIDGQPEQHLILTLNLKTNRATEGVDLSGGYLA